MVTYNVSSVFTDVIWPMLYLNLNIRVFELLTLLSQVITFRSSSLEHTVYYQCVVHQSFPSCMVPVESVEGASVFSGEKLLFCFTHPPGERSSGAVCSSICGKRCVLSTFFPNCLDKLITRHIIQILIPVWKRWVWMCKEALVWCTINIKLGIGPRVHGRPCFILCYI